MYRTEYYDEGPDSYYAAGQRQQPQPAIKRPWSPDSAYHPEYYNNDRNTPGPSKGPAGRIEGYLAEHSYQPEYERQYPNDQQGHSYAPRSRQREASEVSIEALDLADYAHNLRREPIYSNVHYQSDYDPYEHHDPRPPQQQQEYQYSRWDTESDTLPLPPSLVSDHASHSSRTTTSARTPRRQSLPGSYPPSAYPSFAASAYNNSSRKSKSKALDDNDIFAIQPPQPLATGPGRTHSPFIATPNQNNVQTYRDWTRPWFDSGRGGAGGKSLNSYPQPRPSVGSPPSEFGAASSAQSHGYGPQSPPSSHAGLLPWAEHDLDDGDEDGLVSDTVKAERMRILEREFGTGARSSRRAGGEDAEGGRVGSVDDSGALITAGKKKRATGRWLQAIFALGAAISGIYGALFIHPKAIPPPSGKLPAYILYILACLTTILLFYLFAIRPCTQRRRLKKVKAENPAGLTVLPITQALAGGGKKGKKGKGKKGKKGQQDPGAVQVNLIVDPTMFGSNRERRDRNRDEDDDDWDEEDERDEADRRSRRSDRRAPQRRSVFQGLAMEKAWGAARSWLKWTLFIDLVCMILWGGEFVLILLGKRCPSGEFEGWCNAYNTATACACLLALAFAASVFFDIKDLNASKLSPRTRK